MKTLNIDGTLSPDVTHPLDKQFPPSNKFKSAEILLSDGIHNFAQTPDGKTDHVLIPFSDLRNLLHSKCPNFIPPAKTTKK